MYSLSDILVYFFVSQIAVQVVFSGHHPLEREFLGCFLYFHVNF